MKGGESYGTRYDMGYCRSRGGGDAGLGLVRQPQTDIATQRPTVGLPDVSIIREVSLAVPLQKMEICSLVQVEELVGRFYPYDALTPQARAVIEGLLPGPQSSAP